MARLWWSLWTEPGDREVGEFIERVGAAEAARVAHRVLRRGHRQIAKNFSENLSLLRRLASARRPPPTREQVTEVLERCEREKIRLTTPQDQQWPNSLNDLGPHRPRPENEGAQRLIEEWNASVISVSPDSDNSEVRFPTLRQAV